MRFGSTLRICMLGSFALAIACIPADPPTPGASDDSKAATQAPASTGAAKSNTVTADPKPVNLANESPAELLKTLEKYKDHIKDKARNYDINVALGNLYSENGKYIDAIEYFTDALNIAKPVEDKLLADKKPPKGAVPASCGVDHPAPDDIQMGQKTRSLEGIVTAASTLPAREQMLCLEQLRAAIANTHALRGNSWFLVGNPDKAMADHAEALALDPNNPEALFFSGAALLQTALGDPAKIAEGRAYWERLLKVAPNHPRAEFVRQTLPRLNELFGAHPEDAMAGHPPIDGAATAGPGPLPAGASEMAQNFQHTPENEAELDKITEHGEELLKQGKYADAMDEFKRVMPVRPSGRIALDMGIALREEGKPMAEMVLTQAARMPGGDPSRARYELAIFYEKNNKPDQAKAIYTDLEGDPEVGAQAKARLAKLQ